LSINNNTQNTSIPVRILRADGFLARLTGLLGASEWESDHGLLFERCRSIHTFGMRYPLDILFIDSTGMVLEVVRNVAPNQVIKGPKYSESVIEFRAGALDHVPMTIGDQLVIGIDGLHKPELSGLTHLLHWPANVLIATVWSRFVWSALNTWANTPSIIHLGLLIHNTLLLILFLTRRESKESSSKLQDWLIPFFTLLFTLGLRSISDLQNSWMSVSILLQGIGIGCMVISLFSLGRSFGILPSNRNIKISGAYRLIRHPLYVSELIFYSGFLMVNGSIRNVGLILLILIGQIWRAVIEENLLSRDPVYLRYCLQVRYRFIPGLY